LTESWQWSAGGVSRPWRLEGAACLVRYKWRQSDRMAVRY